jgi:mannosylglycoprotein endo-beta-mannosidase
VNGCFSKSFEGKRGVKQGDPLSPLLFVICMEYLSRMLRRCYKQKAIEYHQRCGKCGIHSLLFADDLLLFCGATRKSMEGVKQVLEAFQGTTGLAINEKKSSIYFSRMGDTDKKMLAEVLKMDMGVFPVQYLGLPLSNKRWTRLDCEKLLGKMKAKLKTWSSRNLSYAGRVQVVNTVLLSIGSYWISVFQIPEGVHSAIVELCKNYIWGREKGERGFTAVGWASMCIAKHAGGWGIKDSTTWNKAAMCKLLWDVSSKKDILWIQWLQAFYMKGKKLEQCRASNHHSWSWKVLMKNRDHMLCWC